MSSNKFGVVLTVIIIVAIIGIIGLLIFLGIETFNKYKLEQEAKQGVEQFDQAIANRPNTNTNTNIDENLIIALENDTVENETIANPFENLPEETKTTETKNNDNEDSGNKVQYFKGFVQKGTISIPRTGLNCPILEKASKKAIEVAVGIQVGPGLNEVGNTVIAGHNYRNGLFFSDNKHIEIGDKIYIKDTSGRTVTYLVYNKFETTPEDVSYINKDTNGKREITLYTCNDDSSKRIIIEAREQ
ncbi:MAG: sortase [Clostridia bacterium]|nr:sortase [Clostridia bacterium]